MHANGPHRENVETLRERLDHQEHQWRSVAPRRAAFARIERPADTDTAPPKSGTCPAGGAAAKADARRTESPFPVGGATAEAAELSDEVTRLLQERDGLRHEVEEMRRTRDELAAAVERLRQRAEDQGGAEAQRSVGPGRFPLGFDLDAEDDEMADAFQRFFDNGFEHDKSRRWILSELEQGSA